MPGGCRLEARESLVDYTTENRQEQLLEQLVTKQFGAENSSNSDLSEGSVPAAESAPPPSPKLDEPPS